MRRQDIKQVRRSLRKARAISCESRTMLEGPQGEGEDERREAGEEEEEEEVGRALVLQLRVESSQAFHGC